MSFARRILHYASDAATLVGAVDERAIAGCWFELRRRGGCGPGELRLAEDFADRATIEVGDWIVCERDVDDRWYLGRVMSRRATSPAGISFALAGMAVELAESFAGGYSSSVADFAPPQVYSESDDFEDDPDHADEHVDAASDPRDIALLLLTDHLSPESHVVVDPDRIESSTPAASVGSLKLRGEDSLAETIRDLALRSRNASFGVDEQGEFFFLNRRRDVLTTFQEGVDLLALEEIRDGDRLFNRLTLTGDLAYGPPSGDGLAPRGLYRWKGHYLQPASREAFGERRLRLFVPWIRTGDDAREFAREFFRTYAVPTSRWRIEIADAETLPRPWAGRVRILDAAGTVLVNAVPETVRVEFDRTPTLRIELGPADPRQEWPSPAFDERSQIPGDAVPEFGGDLIEYPTGLPDPFDDVEPVFEDLFEDVDETLLTDHVPDLDVAGHGWDEQWDFDGNPLTDAFAIHAQGPGGENGLVQLDHFTDAFAAVDVERSDGKLTFRCNVGSAPVVFQNVWISVVFRKQTGDARSFWRAVFETLTPQVTLEEWPGGVEPHMIRDGIAGGGGWPTGADYEARIEVHLDGDEIRVEFDLGGFRKTLSYSSPYNRDETRVGVGLFHESRPVRPFVTQLTMQPPP